MAGLPGDGVGIPLTNQAVISTSVDVLDERGFRIGYIQELGVTQNRPVDPIRQLSMEDAGRIIEGAPHVEDKTIRVRGFALYAKSLTDKRSLLNRLPSDVEGAGAFQSLNSQKIPFMIVKKTTHPADPSKTLSKKFIGCYLVSLADTVNIGTATVMEDANVFVTAIEDAT